MDLVRNRKNKKKEKNEDDIQKSIKYEKLIRQEGDGEPSEKQEKHTENSQYEVTKPNVAKINHKSVNMFRIRIEIDIVSIVLFITALITRVQKLQEPRNVVFDELHYGKYVSLYMKRTFFFDSHPPLGKQLIAAAGYLSGFDGKYKFDKIGSSYNEAVPLFALRFVPALCGSLIIPLAYHLMLELGLSQWSCLLAGILLLLENAILTQSRFMLMESMLIVFSLFALLALLKFRKCVNNYTFLWWFWLSCSAFSFSCALCIKYSGFYSCCLGLAILTYDFWKLLPLPKLSDRSLFLRFISQFIVIIIIPAAVYLTVFYIHLNVLYKAGPHDSIMTSAFQASLEGGLASITKGQPLVVAHGSQITLRHTHGRACWLHSHAHVYPIRYPDNRGSSHQQQVTCYSFKDVNNWWIVKRPEKNDLVVEQPIDGIKHGDVVQLVHGMTSRALNSHDVAAAMSPQCQEVTCYIDYNVSMPAQNLWKLEILNREQNGDTWHTIQSLIRLIHVESGQALRFSGKQLPDWGFHQHEVVTDRIINQDDTIWNVEEHRYTKSEDQKDRERDLITAEMIPTSATTLSFWEKFLELQYKMLFASSESVQNHMYSTEPLEWPFMTRGIAYWVSTESNAQIHLLGNIVIWYSATVSVILYSILLIFYMLRRRRLCYDINEDLWNQFKLYGQIFLTGYLFHYIPYFFVERTLFLHHYLPALCFKILLTVGLIEHMYQIVSTLLNSRLAKLIFIMLVNIWLIWALYVFMKFSVLSYGTSELSTGDLLDLRWKDTWDFILHKN